MEFDALWPVTVPPGPVTKELQATFFDIVIVKNSEYREWLDDL